MSLEAQQLGALLRQHMTERHGIFLPFMEASAGLTAAQALHIPREKFNSIWRVTNHLCYWIEAPLLLVTGAGGKPQTPGDASGGWYAPEHATDAEWEALRQRTLEVNARLAEAIGGLDAAGLHAPVPAWQSTPYQIALNILAHNSYHTGEIISLRHLQGLWVQA